MKSTYIILYFVLCIFSITFMTIAIHEKNINTLLNIRNSQTDNFLSLHKLKMKLPIKVIPKSVIKKEEIIKKPIVLHKYKKIVKDSLEKVIVEPQQKEVPTQTIQAKIDSLIEPKKIAPEPPKIPKLGKIKITKVNSEEEK